MRSDSSPARRAAGSAIILDHNAAGRGWSAARTPFDSCEFRRPGCGPAARRIGPLSVLVHDIGHLLGHAHDEHG